MSALPTGLDAAAFARDWIAAWNRRDTEWVLAHFAEDVLFASPIAQATGFSEDGVIRGRGMLSDYWSAALARNPDLHFTLTAVFQGADTLAIAFRNERLEDRLEVLVFENGLACRGSGLFSADAAASNAR